MGYALIQCAQQTLLFEYGQISVSTRKIADFIMTWF